MHTPKIANKLTSIPPQLASLADYELLAEDFMSAVAWAYVQGGSGDEQAVLRNRTAFARYQWLPGLLTDCRAGHSQTRLLDTPFRHPFVLAPVAYQTLVHPQGEMETARAAEATDTLMVSSTLAGLPMEQVIAHNAGSNWFQLYWQVDREVTRDLLNRAERAGFSAVMLTVDTPLQTHSRRLMRLGAGFPEAVRAANLEGYGEPQAVAIGVDDSRVFQGVMASAPTLADIDWLLQQTSLPVLVKGVLNPDDAEALVRLGVRGLVVSNHGGRAFANSPASIACLAGIRHRVGEQVTLLLDSGVRSGYDAFTALALGADAVMIGRPQLHALAIAGALGVAHMLTLLRDELEVAMALAGCPDLAAVRRATAVAGGR